MTRNEKTVWIVAALFAVGAAACGDDDSDDEGGSSEALDVCHAHCKYQVESASDCGADAENNCKQLCDALIANFDEDCQKKTIESLQCLEREKVDFSCQGGDVPVGESPEACDAQSKAYAECFQKQS